MYTFARARSQQCWAALRAAIAFTRPSQSSAPPPPLSSSTVTVWIKHVHQAPFTAFQPASRLSVCLSVRRVIIKPIKRVNSAVSIHIDYGGASWPGSGLQPAAGRRGRRPPLFSTKGMHRRRTYTQRHGLSKVKQWRPYVMANYSNCPDTCTFALHISKSCSNASVQL